MNTEEVRREGVGGGEDGNGMQERRRRQRTQRGKGRMNFCRPNEAVFSSVTLVLEDNVADGLKSPSEKAG